MPSRPAVLSCVLLALALLGCRKPTPADDLGPPWFEDAARGIDSAHDAGPLDGSFFMPQSIGSGCALCDLDGDGLPDVLLLNNGGPHGRPNRLYLQNADHSFRDASADSGLDFAGHCMGVAVGDVDGDGLPDVLLTLYRGVRLFRNLGGGKFRDVTAQAGLAPAGWATAAAFLDYDRDGMLDLVVVHYVAYDPEVRCDSAGAADYCNPGFFPGQACRLYRGRGGWRFDDVTRTSGLGEPPGPGLGVACADFDGDGWPDIFVANDGKPNHLWVNQKDGTFREEAVARGVAADGMGRVQAGMGVALGDVDGDGLFDLFITHLGTEQHTLWRQGPRGSFRDRSGAAGLTTPRWRGTGFGVCLADFDGDGRPDVALLNGRVTRGRAASDDHWSPYRERNQCFANVGGSFRDRSAAEPALCGSPGVGRGLACADFDGDGGLDLLATSAAGPARLLRNVAPNRGHWLAVRALVGKRDALGAEVTVTAGAKVWARAVGSAGSYLSASDPTAHFGLGEAAEYDHVEVRWPDGTRERFAGGRAGGRVEVRQGAGERR